MTQGPTTKSYLTQHAAGAKHKDWATYGKQVMEPFVSGGGKGVLLLPGIRVVTGVIECMATMFGALVAAAAALACANLPPPPPP